MLNEPEAARRNFRLGLSGFVGHTIKSAMELLGVEVPERM